MAVRHDRIRRAQELMQAQGLLGLMVMNHDDYRYFFGRDWSQPRAIIPARGRPAAIAFRAEEPELRRYFQDEEVRVFGHVGEQIHSVVTAFQEIMKASGGPPPSGRVRVGMQMWFDTPAFLVDLFRTVNPRLELVSSDPVMDELRAVKEPEELALMAEAQRIAGLGMDRARQMLAPGVRARDVAAEVTYAMMRAGAERTSTPLHVNFGIDSCRIHGDLSREPLRAGEPVVIDLTPQVEGYCANLARTFVLGEPGPDQARLLAAYGEMREAARRAMVPGARMKDVDDRAREAAAAHGLADHCIDGISHGIGLRFEETPAPTIHRAHRALALREGMTLTIGHTILALPGVAGVRHEDVYRVAGGGGEILRDYPVSPVVPG